MENEPLARATNGPSKQARKPSNSPRCRSSLGSIWDGSNHRWGRELDGDGDGSAGGNRVDGFSRLFGDSDGDDDVDRLDRDLFRSAFGKSATNLGYLWYFDFDGDGDVYGRDNGQFNRRFGQY